MERRADERDGSDVTPQPGFVARARNRFLARLHCQLGAHHRRRQNDARARDHFERALELHETSFTAHLQLGRLMLRDQEHAHALSAFQRAREIDASRFDRVHLTGEEFFLLFERICEIRRQRMDEHGSSSLRVELDVTEDGEDLPYGDFSSRDEFERFSLLPPIAISDVEEIDWAELGRQLAEDE